MQVQTTYHDFFYFSFFVGVFLARKAFFATVKEGSLLLRLADMLFNWTFSEDFKPDLPKDFGRVFTVLVDLTAVVCVEQAGIVLESVLDRL